MPVRRGFTITEVLAVMGILSLLSGIVYVMAGPAREKGREVACASNLKQIYQALSLYAAASDSPPIVDGLGDILSVPGGETLLAYSGTHDIFFCPNFDRGSHPQMWSSYLLNLYAGPTTLGPPSLQGDDSWGSHLRSEISSQGTSFPVAVCQEHFTTYYQPRDDVDPALLDGVFEIRLTLDGSVKAGWFKDTVVHLS